MDDKNKHESNVIAQIDVRLQPSPLERFLDDYHHCPLCGTELIYTHVTQFIENVVAEEAHCPSCKVQTKKNSHALQ